MSLLLNIRFPIRRESKYELTQPSVTDFLVKNARKGILRITNFWRCQECGCNKIASCLNWTLPCLDFDSFKIILCPIAAANFWLVGINFPLLALNLHLQISPPCRPIIFLEGQHSSVAALRQNQPSAQSPNYGGATWEANRASRDSGYHQTRCRKVPLSKSHETVGQNRVKNKKAQYTPVTTYDSWVMTHPCSARLAVKNFISLLTGGFSNELRGVYYTYLKRLTFRAWIRTTELRDYAKFVWTVPVVVPAESLSSSPTLLGITMARLWKTGKFPR